MRGTIAVRDVRWERMFPDELEAAFDCCPVVYMPYGICEPHGPHNALGLDGLKAHGICCAAARTFGGIVAPTDYWHIHECGGYAVWAAERIGERKPWMTAVPPWIHFKNVCYHIRAFDALGFKAAILLTGHYAPNWEDLKSLVALVQPHFQVRLFGLPDFEANVPGYDNDTGDHADKVETSLLWALEPEGVDMSRLPNSSEQAPHFGMGKTAHRANRRIGERMLRDQVSFLGRLAARLVDDYERQNFAQGTPRSYEDVEILWRDVVSPALHQFKSMQTLFDDQSEGPKSTSRWFMNWRIATNICDSR
jgi:creatinine amidohydrolase